MISYNKFILGNGLRVLLHTDKSTPLVATNILYHVGSRDEDPQKTGFAHLFEHLMFSGTQRVPDYDDPIQKAGGENNAFTNNDVTNFYTILPVKNMETGLWIEADRMNGLDITPKAFETQQKVVIEEFKETCLNQPYGDVWHLLSALAYQKHPYRWPTIGLDISHIEDAQLKDVRDFYSTFYTPNNAILVISGNIDEDKTLKMIEKWFSPIPGSQKIEKNFPIEPPQNQARRKLIESDVPADALYMAFKTPDRKDPLYYATDTISDILAHGESSRLYRILVKEKKIFSAIDAYLTGTIDPGLFMIEGRLSSGVSLNQAEEELWKVLNQLKNELLGPQELIKIKNKIYTNLAFSELSVVNKAINLAFYEAMDDADLINKEYEFYQNITAEDIKLSAESIFSLSQCSTLLYKSKA
jgi:zinc protease